MRRRRSGGSAQQQAAYPACPYARGGSSGSGASGATAALCAAPDGATTWTPQQERSYQLLLARLHLRVALQRMVLQRQALGDDAADELRPLTPAQSSR